MATGQARRVGTWTRWQDWVALVVGVLVALSPIVVTTTVAALWTLVVLGVVLALTSLWSLAMPGAVAGEYVHAVVGVLLFIAPWVLGFYALGGAAWVAWFGGVIAVIVGIAAVPAANEEHRLAAQH